MELLFIIFIAFFVAMLFSMLGLGGAIIYTPLFFWTGLPLLTAIPMALLLNFSLWTIKSCLRFMAIGKSDNLRWYNKVS